MSKQKIDNQAKNFDEFQDLNRKLVNSFILGFKYNYNFDKAVQNYGSFHAFIEITENDYIIITNRKIQVKDIYVDELDQNVL